MTLVAMMEDRYLMEIGKEQIYGTQIYGGNVTDKKTGKKSRKYIVWPIKNPGKVNALRKSIGYKQSVEDYALELDVAYKVYNLVQVKEMFDKLK